MSCRRGEEQKDTKSIIHKSPDHKQTRIDLSIDKCYTLIASYEGIVFPTTQINRFVLRAAYQRRFFIVQNDERKKQDPFAVMDSEFNEGLLKKVRYVLCCRL